MPLHEDEPGGEERDVGSTELRPDTILHGRYQIDRRYAKGGMSTIYLGHPLQGAALVIIKELDEPASDTDREEDLQQFEAEYRILRSLEHPGLPLAIDFFEEGGRHYIVEEFVPGDTIKERLEAVGAFLPTEAAGITLALLDVLEYLHQRRIIYRDVTASNVLLARDGRVRLIDFGAARYWRENAERDTLLLGTPGYTPPEQWGSAQTDERSDIYSVGALLHFMLTGDDPQLRPPWTFSPPHDIRPEIPQAISALTMRSLAHDPQERFANVSAMREALIHLGLRDPRTGAHPRTLLNLRRRLCFKHSRDYYRVLETLSMSAFGIFFFAVSVPAWFANVPLPHPLVGMWLTAYAFMHPYNNWKRFRNLTVEIYEEGLRVSSDEGTRDILFDDVVKLKLNTPGVVTAHSADIYARTHHLRLDGVWPGFTDVVSATIDGAGLVERTPGVPWIFQVELNEKIYERALPAP